MILSQKWNHFCDKIMLKLLIWRMFRLDGSI